MNIDNRQKFDDKWKNTIKNECKTFDLNLTDSQLDLFALHAVNLLFWNKTINLTSITDSVQMAHKHFIDSLHLMPHIGNGKVILDIGSGGGFPGFCLKVANPAFNIVMIDSAKKKVNFLKELIRKSSMENITAEHVRAQESAFDNHYKHMFDVVVSRAFTRLDRFVELSKPFLNKTGFILAMKSRAVQEELKLIKQIKGLEIETFSYTLAFRKSKRSIIKITVNQP